MSPTESNTSPGATPFKGFAHPRGSALSLSARGNRWTLTIETADGGPYPPFQDYHQRPMTSADVRRFIHGSGRGWQIQQGGNERSELVALDNGFRVRLTPALGAPLDAEVMVAELEELLGG
ncbi:hypothetical protein [Thiohalorhabdus sp.]|uniref:hypothetical protein n=1 Tax=Thiohalorhabdus sp. TaxID=3094134 RepID=UPI002FC2938B